MWHKPRLMTAVSDLLLLTAGAAVLAAAVVWAAPRLRLFPLHEVLVMHELQEVRQSDVEQALSALLQGNFFTVNPEAVRLAIEELPWVRRAEVWRQWPARLEVRIEEQRAAAHWGDGQGELVNTYGEVFSAPLAHDQSLPRLSGPTGSAGEVLVRYGEFAQVLKPAGVRPVQVALSPRLAWLLKMENGMLVELGREQAKAPIRVRLQRFVDYYPSLSETPRGRPIAVDMRYPNGFALRFPASAVEEVKGKK